MTAIERLLADLDVAVPDRVEPLFAEWKDGATTVILRHPSDRDLPSVQVFWTDSDGSDRSYPVRYANNAVLTADLRRLLALNGQPPSRQFISRMGRTAA